MVPRNRRKDDTPSETGWEKFNNTLRHNVHILLLLLPLLWGAASTLGFMWTGSPQAILAHVDKQDSLITAIFTADHTQQALQNQQLLFELRMLKDTITVVGARQSVVLNVLCQQFTPSERSLIQNTIQCGRPQGRNNSTTP